MEKSARSHDGKRERRWSQERAGYRSSSSTGGTFMVEPGFRPVSRSARRSYVQSPLRREASLRSTGLPPSSNRTPARVRRPSGPPVPAPRVRTSYGLFMIHPLNDGVSDNPGAVQVGSFINPRVRKRHRVTRKCAGRDDRPYSCSLIPRLRTISSAGLPASLAAAPWRSAPR